MQVPTTRRCFMIRAAVTGQPRSRGSDEIGLGVNAEGPPWDRRRDRPATTAALESLRTGEAGTLNRSESTLMRDPCGPAAIHIEQMHDDVVSHPHLLSLDDVLVKTREDLNRRDLAEVARVVRAAAHRSTLSPPEFATRIGASAADLDAYCRGEADSPATLMIRMRRLADRFEHR